MSDIGTGREDGVLVLTLARPHKKNALTGAMYHALSDALAAAEQDTAIGAVLIRGSGGVFCAGNDIADFISGAGQPGEFPAFRFVKAIARFGKPLIAAVEGPAVGIGTTMLLHCDLVYAAPSAMLRLPFVDLGIVPEAGSSLLLPQRIGHAKAAEMLMLCEAFDTAEAHRLGLVNTVVPAETLHEHALAKARALASKPRESLAITRRLMRGDLSALHARIEEESKLFAERMASAEARAAFERFLSRPAPKTGTAG